MRILAAKVVKPKTVRLSVTASRSAPLTASLWKGQAKVAQAKATGTKATINLVSKAALKKGAYVVEIVSGSASASKAVTVEVARTYAIAASRTFSGMSKFA